jgi:hypothetical protein
MNKRPYLFGGHYPPSFEHCRSPEAEIGTADPAVEERPQEEPAEPSAKRLPDVVPRRRVRV